MPIIGDMARFTGSVLTGGLSGKAGTVVFVTRKDGIQYVKPRVTPRNPRTAGQTAARERMAAANRAWQSLDQVGFRQWAVFTEQYNAVYRAGIGLKDMGVPQLFVMLATKFLQVNPNGLVPTEPPLSVVVGDNVGFTLETIAAGKARLFASQANALGMVTEVLIQVLPTAGRTAREGHFRHYGVVAFSSAGENFLVEYEGRFASVAVRFVCEATGQASGLMVVGVAG